MVGACASFILFDNLSLSSPNPYPTTATPFDVGCTTPRRHWVPGFIQSLEARLHLLPRGDRCLPQFAFWPFAFLINLATTVYVLTGDGLNGWITHYQWRTTFHNAHGGRCLTVRGTLDMDIIFHCHGCSFSSSFSFRFVAFFLDGFFPSSISSLDLIPLSVASPFCPF